MTASPVPTVSVVVPTHNRADLIGDTLRSVLAQTFPDFEVVVVDNGSTDGTDRVVAVLKDPRIRYYWQQDSGLPANSRNVGIRMARGRYIAFLDSDDLWLPGKLALQIPYMDTHPGYAFTCTDAEVFPTTNLLGRRNRISLMRRRSIRDLMCGNFVQTLTVVVRRDCLEAVGGFNEDPRMKAAEDYDLWLRLGSRYSFKYFRTVTARRRVHGGSLAGGDPASGIERAISTLRRLHDSLGVPERDFACGLAVHYRRLARAQALVGNREGYRAALMSSWQACPGWKTYMLLALYMYTGFRLSKSVTALFRQLKYLLDDSI